MCPGRVIAPCFDGSLCIFAVKMSESTCTDSSASGWGFDDPLVNVVGVHTTVLGGRPVWPLALQWLLTVNDRMAYLEHRMAQVDFTALPLEARTDGAYFVELVWGGHDADWGDRRIAPDQADRVLAALGLLHLRVKCVVNGSESDYDHVVSYPCGWCVWVCLC